MLFIAFNEFVTFYGDFFICAIYAEFFLWKILWRL